ncbi:MAG: SpoIID/LytB domain-containing protein [Phycisphaerae bacterium]
MHKLLRLVVGLLVVVFGAGCRKTTMSCATGSGGEQSLVTVRDVRVLLADRDRQCRVRVEGPLQLKSRSGRTLIEGDGGSWVVVSVDDQRGIRFGDRMLGAGVFELGTERFGAIEMSRREAGRWSSPRRYAGTLRFSVNAAGGLRVINLVGVEIYVACVLPGEIYRHFHTQAYRAQAVAARTYALYQMASREQKPYDVSATESSQVYPGLGVGRAAQRAREAVDFTRGIVATWTSPHGEQIFCTYYSSCCGGMTQDVANCRQDVPSIPPLAGSVPCKCSRVAALGAYRWKAVRISKSQVTSRLVARHQHLNKLGRIESIDVVKRTNWGRPKVLRLVGSSGRNHNMVAEDFRLAMGSRTLRSTSFKIRNDGEHFEFVEGRGFGHGMGMCQWGMQEMALRGHRAGAILKHYYPGMHLTRAY